MTEGTCLDATTMDGYVDTVSGLKATPFLLLVMADLLEDSTTWAVRHIWAQ